MGEGTSAARAEVLAARAQVLAAREALDEELVRLEASARAAVDIQAKIKRNPGKTAGLAAGAGFLAIGGPKRVFRRAKRAVMGPEEPLPTSMLPKEIDAALGSLGTDGERVRGVDRAGVRELPRRRRSRPAGAATWAARSRSCRSRSCVRWCCATASTWPTRSSRPTPRSTTTGSRPSAPGWASSRRLRRPGRIRTRPDGW